jgi:hypothetical protein
MIFALLSLYVGGALTERENPRQARLMRSIGEKNQTILKVPGNIPTDPTMGNKLKGFGRGEITFCCKSAAGVA